MLVTLCAGLGRSGICCGGAAGAGSACCYGSAVASRAASSGLNTLVALSARKHRKFLKSIFVDAQSAAVNLLGASLGKF